MEPPGWAEFQYLIECDFGMIAARRIQLQILTEEIEGLNLEIGALLDTIEQKTVRVEYQGELWNITRTGGGGSTKRLVESLLLDHGVHPMIIKRSKVPTAPRSPSIQITRVRKEPEFEAYPDFADE